MKIKVILNNIRSTYNVGAIIRTAEGFGAEEVILAGITPRVHDNSLLPHLREKLDNQIHKSALGAEEMVKVRAVDDICAELQRLRDDGNLIVGLENNIEDERQMELGDFQMKISAKEREKVALILGEEVDGIDRKLYEYVDVFVEIPMKGRKESFNVSVAAGVALWELCKH